MSDFAGLKVLIVDNNTFIAKTLYSILDAFGIKKLTLCKTLEDAEKLFYNKTYDAIFIDFMLENRKGLNFIKMIRASSCDKNPADIPVILNTGLTDIDTITMARDAGVTEVIGKPFSPDQVYKKTYNALFNRREFINVDEYVGPNRRRKTMNIPEWTGDNDRRSSTGNGEQAGGGDE
ncbi:response regulator [Pseudemcibacter aquimaris]|uniref:response regulator n=1 Tax=Pseudemcibacter aquimaris TaxID=2857064 RepID=UPI0020118368|nr:response regulator [Pseudemcibacter aquimaris]MCC3861518.1 response regulator [Pseudemcibacter aquimaris]WDU58287.1 response regulator [Pseudemcibacter aquimaris]